MNSRQLILASSSPRRQTILHDAGFRHRVEPPEVEEFNDPHASPVAVVHHNARIKAMDINSRYPGEIIISADTVVMHQHDLLGKPENREQAYDMLRRLSGDTHQVHTGVCVMGGEENIDDILLDVSDVTFKPFTEDVIQQYFSVVDPLDKAGGYGIQDGASLILERYSGSYTNIMGLPIEKLESFLEEKGLASRYRIA